MRISKTSHLNQEGFLLENDLIKLTVLPHLGGKIASIRYKPARFECLFQPMKNQYEIPSYGARFEDFDKSGLDDCFPSIDACLYPYPNFETAPIPDHGELWSIPWSVEESEDALICEADGHVLPYGFKREISLSGNRILLNYEVYNSSDFPIFGLYAFHGLLACDERSRIFLPDEVSEVVNVHDSELLGKSGSLHGFPISSANYAFDRISPPSAQKTEKFYANTKLKTGEASVSLNKDSLLFKLHFDPKILPFLGVWLCEGAGGAYNLALEPSNGFYDSLEITKSNGLLEAVLPKKSLKWKIEIELSEI